MVFMFFITVRSLPPPLFCRIRGARAASGIFAVPRGIPVLAEDGHVARLDVVVPLELEDSAELLAYRLVVDGRAYLYAAAEVSRHPVRAHYEYFLAASVQNIAMRACSR